ncbi:hypothetical protein FJT64_002183 [Amphibalanus amphitrite]|uniref:Uncharacterized protein n=1 Tax=Amphibalanus amphitrite TaxID=1232801 RepID=A0A6A4WLI7_AMPAM|nr:hypothetical protein FJT64_002183 [Amphibalanus amphitrite]
MSCPCPQVWTAAVTGAAADGGRQGGSSLNRLGRLPSVASIPLARTSDQLPLPSRRVIEPESPSEEAAASPARSRSRAIAVISPPVSRRERLRKIAERRARVLERLAAAKSSRSSVSVQRTAPAAGPEPRRTAAAARRSSSRLENFRPSPRIGEATFRPTGPLGLSPLRSTPLHLVS